MHVSPLDLEVLKAVYAAGYMRTDQIEETYRLLAARDDVKIADKALTRVVQRDTQRFTEAGVLQRDKPPVRLDERKGPPHYIYSVGKAGLALLSEELGIPQQELRWRPTGDESLLFLDHMVAIVDYHLALAKACAAQGITLTQWEDERILRKEPARVTLVGEDSEHLDLRVVPDAIYQLQLPSGGVLTCLLEIDLGTSTVNASKWKNKSWRRKFLGFQVLPSQKGTNPAWATGNFIVTTVTKSPNRLAHLKAVCEEVGGDHHFWFSTLDAVQAETVLGTPVWYVAGKGDGLHSLLPRR